MNEIALMEAASSVYKRKYQCPYCNEKYDRVKLVDHIEKKHSEFIPKDFTASRIVFNIVNKKEKGKCTICGKESPWDEDKCRYDRFCSEKCKKAYEQLAAERLKRVRGMTKQEMLKDPEYQNNVMLANRNISGKYKFQDGTIRTYVGSYEHKFLEFMDKFLNVKSEDLETPGPIIEYKFKEETHKWITDAYYAPYNLAFDIKDGGDNPNKREMPEYRAKQTAKEDAIRKQGKYNYIRLTDNKFEQLIELMLELKELYIENNGEYNPIIRINESTNLLESDSEMEVYRCTYKGEGIYEALRKNVDLETWKSILSSDKINWLPKPPQYKSDKNCRSYFTYKGYKKFSKDVLPIMYKYLDKKYIKIDKLYIYGKPLYQDEYQIVISKELDESTVLESKKVKDLGPKVCSKCGSKNIGVFFQGEPIYKCKDCGEYLGTVPFNESTSNDIIQNAFNSVIHTIKWCRMDDSAFCSIKEYNKPNIISDNSFSAGKFAYESGIDTVVKTVNDNNIFENGRYSASCNNNELIITIDKLNNINESYIIDKIYKGDNNMIHENSMKSAIDKDFKAKGKLSLSEFKRVTFDKSIIDKYKNTTKNLKHTDPKDKGYAWIDKDGNLAAYCTVDDSKDKNIWITAVEVTKDYQGYGLSKQLLDVATKELKANALSVSINNKLAKRVYEKYGFKVSKDSEESVKKGKSTMYFMYIGNINESKSTLDLNHKTKKTDTTFKFIDLKDPSVDKYLKQDKYCTEYWDYVHKSCIGEIVIDADSDCIAGYVFLDNKKYPGFITPVVVIKKYRGYGLSSKLVKDAINKYKAIDLTVTKDNEVAIKLYKDNGFVIIGDGNSKNEYWMKLKSKLTDEEKSKVVNESSNKSTLEELLSLNMKLNLFEYGLPVNGQITDVKSSKYWDENYKTMSTSEFEQYKGGICWDYVFYQDYILKKLGIQHTNYYIISSNYQTHTITVAKDSGKLYYIESSFKRICGVYPADNINDILFFVIKKMGIPDYYVFKINSFPKTHSTSNEYMQFMEDKGTLIMKGKSNSIKDVKLDNIQKSFKFPKDDRNIKEYCVLHDKGYFKLLDKYKDPKYCSWDEEQTYPTIDECIKAEKCFGKDRYCYIMNIDTYSIHYIGKMHISNFEDDGYSVDWLEITDDYPFPRDDTNEACKNTEEDWSKSIKEFSIITPSSDKPSQEGFIGHGSWNAIKKVNGEPYRERVEVIIFNKELDKVLIGTRKSDGSVKLPGGGTDKNSSLESQAAKECQEEVKVNIDNLKYIGSYSMPNKQTGYKNDVYKGQYTYLYLATYDSDYTGYIRPEDLDSLYDTAEWMNIYDAKKLLKKRSVDLYNLFNYNYKLYINDLSYLKL